MTSEEFKQPAVSSTKEYHNQKSKEFYLKTKENGKYKIMLQKKNMKYSNDPDFKERVKQKNKERYHRMKQQRNELINQVALLTQ